jgi:hypothetical protein
VHGPGEGRTISLGDAGVVTLKAERVETGGTLSAYEFVMPPRRQGHRCTCTGDGTSVLRPRR